MAEKGTWEKIVDAATKNLPLFLVVLSSALALVAANGGLEKAGLRDIPAPWRVFLAVVSVLIGGLGGRLILRGWGNLDTSSLSKDCDLRITSPRPGSEVHEKTELEGTYKKRPPGKVTVVAMERTPSGRNWFKEPVQFSRRENKWSATISSGGRDEKRTLWIAMMGEAGEALRDYFRDVYQRVGRQQGIPTLTPDVSICDEVEVYYRALTPPSDSASPTEHQYGIKIQLPGHKARVGKRIHLEGTFQQMPSGKRLAIIEYVPHDDDYWFQGRPTFVDQTKRWFADIEIGGTKEQERVLQVALLGPAGQALMDYCLLLAERNVWEGLKTLPSDVIKCDEVGVYFCQR